LYDIKLGNGNTIEAVYLPPVPVLSREAWHVGEKEVVAEQESRNGYGRFRGEVRKIQRRLTP